MTDSRSLDPFQADPERLMDSQQGQLRIAARIIVIACLCMGTIAYIGHARLGDVDGHAVFISPYFALVMILCGLALHAARAYTRHAPLFGIAMIGMLVWALIAPRWYDAWVNGRTVSAAFATSVALLGALVALALRNKEVRRPPSAWPRLGASLTALLGIALPTLLSYGLIENDIVTRQRFANASARTVANEITERISRTVAFAGRQAQRWKVMGHVPSQAFLREEFDNHLSDFLFFDGFALVDTGPSIVAMSNRAGVTSDWVRDSITNRSLRSVLDHVIDSGNPHFVLDDRLSGNQNIGLIITPQSNPAMKGWYTITRLNLVNIFMRAIAKTPRGYFSINHDGRTLYRTADTPPENPFAAGELTIALNHDLDLKLAYAYAKAPGDLGADVLPEFVLLAGLLFTFLLGSSQRLARIARERSDQLSHSALHDPLTGLPNRRMLEQTLQDACTRARTGKSSVSVVFLDLDGIKLINDSMGHRIGDTVLMEASDRLLNDVQLDGSVTHLGGDEFVLLFPGLELRQVQERTQHIMHELAKPYFVTGKALRVTTNAGITISDGHTRDHMQLVREADLAMLRAKQDGQNTWHTYTEDLSARVADRLELRNDLQSALDAGALELHYQPIIAGHSGRVVGVEALVRWRHPTRGYISPSRFIPLSEETGQIASLTEWVLATACRDSDALRKKGFSALPVIINISPLYFQRTDFVEKIRKNLSDATLPATLLSIEITEGVLLDDKEAAILKLTQLRDMGIQTSIDDFGTGYSNLNYLKNLPIFKVKIDRSFVTDVVHDPAAAAIAQGIISMAHHLGLKVIAEGVETESQLAFLKRSHCDEFQGYLFARPLTFDELIDRLSENSGHFTTQPLDTATSERVLLLVDDEQNILNALTRLLRRDGYRILTANNAPQALELLARHEVQVIVSDQRMPEMTGTEFFSKVKEMYPATTRMILSGYTDLKSVTEAINHGAIYKFITKPWDDESLRKDIEQAFIDQRSRDVQEILNAERERLR
ncbi:EAL domain-containing protein [Castellaniella denitrificans]|uniref:EAL domain-containing protein n=1 Tax=Castellaniella denitrificans TaxID=56119 RepID=A0ABT4M4D5_9BURK|nr:EAL domain-containing protein [Castellaniella denitrificans]MCZ4330151.1 EAL domain-containing protein [Castellaniella denitrificans]